jgi:hypothetical protein
MAFRISNNQNATISISGHGYLKLLVILFVVGGVSVSRGEILEQY